VRHRRRFYAAKCQSNRQPKQKKHTHHHRRNTEKGLIKQSDSCDVTNLVPAGATLRSRPSRWCNFGCGRGPSSGGFGGDV
jgi:hypothetical protein